MCNKQITTGEQLFVVDENKFVCKQDYMLNKSQGNKINLIKNIFWAVKYINFM